MWGAVPGILFEDQLERLVVPIFLHSGLLHLAMNVMAQFTIGLQAEFKWGMETGSLRPHTLVAYALSSLPHTLVA